MVYRSEIDGLRALAVLAVIFYHAKFTGFTGGYVGVDVFFVISGYLITSIILADLKSDKFSLVNFYERRARRILPALFLVLATCIPFAWIWLLPDDMESFSHSIVAVPLFISNFLFWQESGYFDIAAELKPLLHTWSLAVEEQYYLLFPLFLLSTWQFSKQSVGRFLLIGMIASLLLAQWGASYKPEANFFLLPSRIWELAIGALIAYYFSDKGLRVVNASIGEFCSGLGLLLIIYSVVAFDNNTPFPSLYGLIPTIGAALILLFASETTTTGRFLSKKPLVGIGLVSYSAYLWHQPIFAFARHKSNVEPGPFLMVLLVVLALVLAYLSWKWVERPFRKPGVIDRKSLLIFSLTASLFFVAFGLFGSSTNGFSFRDSEIQKALMQQMLNIKEERQTAISAGTCHFNNRAKAKQSINEFLEQWSCNGVGEQNLVRIPIAVTGDSHSADVVVALKENGFAPLQLGGAGCSLVPSLMNINCRKMFERLRLELGKNSYYSHLLLVNHYKPEELTEDAILEMVHYWKKFQINLVVFVGMPNFPNSKKLISRGRVPVYNPELSLASKKHELMEIYKKNGIYVIDREKYYCGGIVCDYKTIEGEYLFTDDTHLSIYGARVVGERLINEDPLLANLIADTLSEEAAQQNPDSRNSGHISKRNH